MKKFLVTFYYHTNLKISVDAENEKDALKNAERLIGDDKYIDELISGLVEDDSPTIECCEKHEEEEDEKDEDMEQALDYIRERLEDYELEEIRAKVNSAYEQHTTPTAYDDFSHIADLLEEYGEDNDYPEGWWMELGDLDDWVVEI